MTDEQKPQSFWQTVPGVLTGIAAVLTAMTGLLVALHQLGVFGANTGTTSNTDARPPAPNAPLGRGETPTPGVPQPAREPETEVVNLLSPQQGGKLAAFTEPGWKQTIAGPRGYGVVGAQQPAEAVYSFRDNGLAIFDAFRVLVSSVSPSNVKDFELFAATDSASGPFTPIGRFETRNLLVPETPYQEFRFRATTARYLKVRLLSNHNGYANPLEIRELQLVGHLVNPGGSEK